MLSCRLRKSESRVLRRVVDDNQSGTSDFIGLSWLTNSLEMVPQTFDISLNKVLPIRSFITSTFLGKLTVMLARIIYLMW